MSEKKTCDICGAEMECDDGIHEFTWGIYQYHAKAISYRCPCCGYEKLGTCTVKFWEDDCPVEMAVTENSPEEESGFEKKEESHEKIGEKKSTDNKRPFFSGFASFITETIKQSFKEGREDYAPDEDPDEITAKKSKDRSGKDTPENFDTAAEIEDFKPKSEKESANNKKEKIKEGMRNALYADEDPDNPSENTNADPDSKASKEEETPEKETLEDGGSSSVPETAETDLAESTDSIKKTDSEETADDKTKKTLSAENEDSGIHKENAESKESLLENQEGENTDHEDNDDSTPPKMFETLQGKKTLSDAWINYMFENHPKTFKTWYEHFASKQQKERHFLNCHKPKLSVILNSKLYDTEKAEMYLATERKIRTGTMKEFHYRMPSGSFFKILCIYGEPDELVTMEERDVRILLSTQPDLYRRILKDDTIIE